jgi:hypothetical protein
MLSIFQFLAVGTTLVCSYGAAAPLAVSRRAIINHDAVIGFPQTVPSGIVGTLMLKYKPFLEVYNGCVPFPAVNSAGDTGYVVFHAPNVQKGFED